MKSKFFASQLPRFHKSLVETILLSASLVLILAPASPVSANSDVLARKVFTLPEAVQYAADHYPSVRAALERRSAARANVAVARDNYLPRADALWQTNRATRNNIAGVLLTQSTIPNPSGPILDSSTESFWGTGTGLTVAWEPFDFGYRRALVRSAQATTRRTEDQITLTLLDVETAAADGALTVLATEQTAHAVQADIDRRTVLARSVGALVDAHLRPGADASRAQAELAAARTQMIQAEQNAALAKASLAELLGLAGTEVDVAPGPLLDLPTVAAQEVRLAAQHPLAVVDQDRVLEARARVQVLRRSYAPRFDFQGTGYGRASGAKGTGYPSPDSTQGLVPDTVNWAAGINIRFATLDFFSLRSRTAVEQANERQQEQVYGRTIQTVTARAARARIRLDAAQRIAENTPLELQASHDAELQARARFKAGLATLVEVAEAQRLLVNAEIDDALARLSIWRALERMYAAEGDLKPFLEQVGAAASQPSTGAH